MRSGISWLDAGDGPAVVCLHGIGGAAESFLPQMASTPSAPIRAGGAAPRTPRGILGKRKAPRGLDGYRVIAWDLPGYGGSAAGSWPPTFGGLSARLGMFLDELGLERVHLVGQSIGGMIALEHAVRRPDQVATLGLIGTTPAFGGRDDSFRDAFLAARLAPLEAGKTMAELADETARGLVGPNASAGVIADVAEPLARVDEATWRGILECLVTFNRRDDLEQIAAPACVIAGSHDQNAPARTMEKMAARLPDAEYHLIDGAGHMINQEAPAATNRILQDFFRRHPI